MIFGEFHTYENEIDRKTRKALGKWTEPFAVAVWTTKEGNDIKVRNMGHSHLINTIKLLYRAAATRKNQEDIFLLAGPQPRGDMATMTFNEVCDGVFSKDTTEYVNDIYWDMMEEAKHRGIDIGMLEAYFKKVEDARFTLALRAMNATRHLG